MNITNIGGTSSVQNLGAPIPHPVAQVVFLDPNLSLDSTRNETFIISCFQHLPGGAYLRSRLRSLLRSIWLLTSISHNDELECFVGKLGPKNFECYFCATDYGGIPQAMNCIKAHIGYKRVGCLPVLESLMEKRAPSDLSGKVVIPDGRRPAYGGIAVVYAGVWGNKRVAIKVLNYRKRGKADAYWEASNERRVRREINVWAALKHPNINEFLGYSTDFSDFPAMISPWCRHGTASEYLESQDLPVNKT